MLHVMLHLRFHFNQHKKLQKNMKKMHLVSQLMVHFKMQCKGTPLNLKLGSLRVLYILYSAEQSF